jgi:hypothetical protein
LLPDRAPTSSWATEFLTHASTPPVAKSLQPATPRQHHPGYSSQGQLFQPSFSHSASHLVVSVNVVRMLRLAALRPQGPMHAMSHVSSFAHLPQTTTPNFHSGPQIDSALRSFLDPTIT